MAEVLQSGALPIVSARTWEGRASARDLVIFGDSYSVKELDGAATWTSALMGLLDLEDDHVYNYAVPGATAEEDLSPQLAKFHRRRAGSYATPDAALYVIAFGINDCGTHWPEDLDTIVEKVLDAAHELYVKAGARNFLILDVPPIDRSSRVQAMGLTELMAPRYAAWNTLLSAHVSDFASSTPKANVFLFSQHHVLSRIIDGPDVYGLAGEDEIWADELHLTEKTHRVFAAEVFKALFSES